MTHVDVHCVGMRHVDPPLHRPGESGAPSFFLLLVVAVILEAYIGLHSFLLCFCKVTPIISEYNATDGLC